MKNFLMSLAIFCPLAGAAFSQSSFSPEVRRVAVFKNGYAFTFREGAAQTSNGWVYTANAPVGVLGSVWGYAISPSSARVEQLLATTGETKELAKVSNLADFLLANEGAQARFATQFYEKEAPRIFTGTYEIFKSEKTEKQPTDFQENYAAYNLSNLTVAVKTDGGTVVLPATAIQTVELLGAAKTATATAKKSNLLGLKIEGAPSGQTVDLGIAALERGIRWIPAYRVEVKGAPVKEAKLELEAMLINELTDLKNTEVNFVVGVPHFLFQDQISPLSLNTAFAGVSSYFRTGVRGGQNAYSNAIATQVASTADAIAANDDDERDATPTVAGEEQIASFSAEQLYLYKADAINLKKGERASLRLFSLTVPASEVFEWTLDDAADTANRYMNQNGNYLNQQAAQDLTGKIWSALRLKNQTGMPWTTAPALSFREWKPLGQDMLTFTPVGGDNILRVTPATEVVGTHSLEEKARERVQLNYSGSAYNFDLVTVEGSVKLRNAKREAVELVLTRNLVGEVLEATDGGKITKAGLNLQALNPNSVVKWNLNLSAGGEREIRYAYKIYIRR